MLRWQNQLIEKASSSTLDRTLWRSDVTACVSARPSVTILLWATIAAAEGLDGRTISVGLVSLEPAAATAFGFGLLDECAVAV
jgi:hypothetical protein